MGALVPAEKKREFRQQLAGMGGELKMALPDHVPAERFQRATQTAVLSDPELLRCDRASLFQAVMKSAECGLMPNGQDAALVRFKGQVQFIPMFGGLLKLMRNSGEVVELLVDVVCNNDTFSYRLGDDANIEHVPELGERGVVVAAYAILKTKGGGTYRAVMSRGEIEKIRNRSSGYRYAESKGKKNTPWHTDFEEMAKKTVLRRLAKICPLSTDDIDRALTADNETYDLSVEAAPAPSPADKLAAALTAPKERGAEGAAVEAVTAEVVEAENAPDTDEGWNPIRELQASLSEAGSLDDVQAAWDGWEMVVSGEIADEERREALLKEGRGYYNQMRLQFEKKAQ